VQPEPAAWTESWRAIRQGGGGWAGVNFTECPAGGAIGRAAAAGERGRCPECIYVRPQDILALSRPQQRGTLPQWEALPDGAGNLWQPELREVGADSLDHIAKARVGIAFRAAPPPPPRPLRRLWHRPRRLSYSHRGPQGHAHGPPSGYIHRGRLCGAPPLHQHLSSGSPRVGAAQEWEQRAAAASAQDQQKRCTSSRVEPSGCCVMPFSVESYGRLGQHAMKLLHELKAAGPRGVTRASFADGEKAQKYFRQKPKWCVGRTHRQLSHVNGLHRLWCEGVRFLDWLIVLLRSV
jgi:hypothetical protein